jgi:hypothetical protein
MAEQRDANGNVVRKEDYVEVVIWPGTRLVPDNHDVFVDFMAENYDVDVQPLEEIKVGAHYDLLFAVHRDDERKLRMIALQAGMYFLSDMLAAPLQYPPRVWIYAEDVCYVN